MRPTAVADGEPHRADRDPYAALLLPCLDPIDQPIVGAILQLLSQPSQVDPPRIVPPAGLLLDVSSLSVPSEKPADAGLSDAEQGRRRSIGTALSRPVRLYQTSLQIERMIRHPHV
jgi:hypothetical protein